MYIYLISQSVNTWYDTYDSAVVVAESGEAARNMHPSGISLPSYDPGTWANKEDVEVVYVGSADGAAKNPCVLCASFNAG